MQIRNLLKSKAARFGAVGAGLLSSVAAFADDPFSAAITAATTTVNTDAAQLVTLAGVAVGFMIGVKYVKKIVRAA